MWTIIILIALAALILYNIARVALFGKSIIRPNFRRVDEKFSARTGFASHWNTPFGKFTYYFFLIAIILFIALLVFIVLH